jgi:hypothetical protein
MAHRLSTPPSENGGDVFGICAPMAALAILAGFGCRPPDNLPEFRQNLQQCVMLAIADPYASRSAGEITVLASAPVFCGIRRSAAATGKLRPFTVAPCAVRHR